MPRYVQVSVNAYGMLPGQSSPIYNDKVAQFDVQLLSSIKVEKHFKNGVKLGRTHRKETVRIFSSSDFDVEVAYNDGNNDQQRIKHQISRPDQSSNDYNLTVFVPNDVVDDFDATIKLVHPYTKFMLVLQLSFRYEAEIIQKSSYYEPERQQPLRSSPNPVYHNEPEYDGMPTRQRYQEDSGSKSWTSYFVMLVLIGGGAYFVWKNHYSEV